MSSNLKVNSLVPATGTEIGIGTTGGSIDFRCPATFGGNVTIGGTLTYDEVINIDSIGIITARSNIDCNGDLDVDGQTNLDHVNIAGITTLSTGINLTAATSFLYATDGTLSYYATNNGVYLNGAGANGWLRLQAAGSANDRTSINLKGHSMSGGDSIYFRTNSTERLNISSTGSITISGNFSPTANNTYDLGGTSNLWRHLYVNNVNVAGVVTATQFNSVNGSNTGFFKDNQLSFSPTGDAYIDHRTNNKDIYFRLSRSSALDTTMMQFDSDGEIIKFHKIISIGLQGGNDTATLGGGSGVGAQLTLKHSDGSFNTRLLGSGDSYLNAFQGNLGIGTQSPQRKLHVIGTTRPAEFGSYNAVSTVKLYNSATGRGAFNGFDFTANSTSGGMINFYGGSIDLRTSTSNGSDATSRLLIMDNGTAIFGGKLTNSSSYTSHNTNFYGGDVNTGGVRIEVAHSTTTVSGNTASAAFPHHLLLSNYSGNGSADNRMCSIGFDIPTTSTHANAVIAYQATAAGTGDLQFHLESGNSVYERIRFTSSGQLLMGGNTGFNESSALLSVHTDASAGANMLSDSSAIYNHNNPAFLHIANRYNTGTGQEAGIILHSKSSYNGSWAIYSKRTSTNYYADLLFRCRTGNGASRERLHLHGNGDITFNNCSTTIDSSNYGMYLLNDSNTTKSVFLRQSREANGTHSSAEFYGNQGAMKIYGDGDVKNTNNSYGQLSDETLKQDIVDASSQWDDIKAIRVRKFRFKDNPTGVLQIGVIAQELETVSPKLVTEVATSSDDLTSTETVKAVKYSVLYMKAIKALQEAQTRIETLEAKVSALEGS